MEASRSMIQAPRLVKRGLLSHLSHPVFLFFIAAFPSVVFSQSDVGGAFVYRGEYITASTSTRNHLSPFDLSLHRTAEANIRAGGTPIVPYDVKQANADCRLLSEKEKLTFCEPNFVRFPALQPDDRRFPNQWALHSALEGYHLNAPLAWQSATGSKEVTVGVLDTGVNYLHPDLLANLWRNPGELEGNGKDDDQNGYVDDLIGSNVVTRSGSAWDCDGHGSHVAGVLGGSGNNKIGVAGVNWQVSILPVALSACDEFASFGIFQIVEGMRYFIEMKQRYDLNVVAVNASFSGAGASQAERSAIEALQEEGVVFVTAAGNSGLNIDVWKSYPAAYGLENIVAVGAATEEGVRAGFSNYGVETVDITAPGVNILSTSNSHSGTHERYETLSGTSMAAPFVSGAIALLSSLRPDLSPSELIQRVYQSARVLPLLDGEVYGARALDLGSLLSVSDEIQIFDSDLGSLLIRYTRRAKHALQTTSILAKRGTSRDDSQLRAASVREASRSLDTTLRRLRKLAREIQWLSLGRTSPALRIKRMCKRSSKLYREYRRAARHDSREILLALQRTLRASIALARKFPSIPQSTGLN